ncbi:predicted protein [Naegleria gruberi]|uniref:Predicted protein n=1 Tax=Naegleria gruberi TaxID=5762 RepID=D2UZE6_NAEGR|nr:uncharacterized protein NAEGRDRAFT_61909 [Naegleria gruberi]EFC50134.1 predicted protein [Naegleria gruberi]|eukprot:XP_002682878.1 predicted protein [Naegleria gruberi strain NEG-M]
MGRRPNIQHTEKQLLQHKVNVLSKIGQERNQYGYSRFKERDLCDAEKPSMYLRYKHLYNNDMAQEEDDIFKNSIDSKDSFLNEINDKKQEEEQDDFFIDPETVSKKKQKKLSKMKFKQCEEKRFTSSDGEVISFDTNTEKSKKRRREYGEHVMTPSIELQRKLDPKHFKENVNFIPIPEKSNRLLKKKKIQNVNTNKEQVNHDDSNDE